MPPGLRGHVVRGRRIVMATLTITATIIINTSRLPQYLRRHNKSLERVLCLLRLLC